MALSFHRFIEPMRVEFGASQYGAGLKGSWRWAFFETGRKNDDEDGSIITVSTAPYLVAVTDKQFRVWSKIKITRKHRIVLCLERLSVKLLRLLGVSYEGKHR